MIRGVIFDFGSTLISFHGEVREVRKLATQAMVKHLHDEKVTLNNGTFIKRFNELLELSFEARESTNIEISSTSVLRLALTEFGYAAVGDEILDRALERFYNHYEDCWQPMPDLHSVLDEIQNSDYRLGMISNAGNADNVQRLIDKVDIRKYFDPVLISSGVGLRKPHRLLFEAVLHTWQLPAEQVVMIGDMLHADVLGAQRAGMHQIWITADADNESNRQNVTAIEPEATTDNLRDVPGLIRSMASS
jgi:putative hydrolase of the HAD superfamily